jgi:hypothetical protein
MEITLKIYKTPAGQWAGILLEDNVEIGRISGCSSSAEVVTEAIDQGYAKFTVVLDI